MRRASRPARPRAPRERGRVLARARRRSLRRARLPALRAGPRPRRDGPLGRALRGLLPVRVRRLDEERTRSRRTSSSWGVYGKLDAGQPALPARHPRGASRRRTERARCRAAEDRRLLRRLHGRGGGRGARRRAAAPVPRAHRRASPSKRDLRRRRSPRCTWRHGTTPACSSASAPAQDFSDATQRDRLRSRRRPRPPRPRLLPEGRREVARTAHEVRGPRRADARAAGRRGRRRRGAKARHGDGDRDRARQGLAHPRRASATPYRLFHKMDRGRAARARARASTGPRTCAASGLAAARRVQRDAAGVLPARSSASSRTTPRRLQGLPALAPGARDAPACLSAALRARRTSRSTARRCAACRS